MLKLCTSLLFGLIVYSNGNTQAEIANDSVVHLHKYGLRTGIDASKIARSFLEQDYSGFEIMADFRLSRRIYMAAELGFEDKKTNENIYLSSTAKGSFLKAGLDFNMYENWFGMENLIYTGIRVGVATFEQTLNNYTIYNTYSQTWGPTEILSSTTFENLNTIWAELILGLKTEIFNNFFVGINVQLKGRLSETSPENFENIYIPGFGRTYDSAKIGTGISYNISYLIPIFKKRASKEKVLSD